MRIVVLANTAWYLYNFRLNLIRALKEEGHEVIAVSPTDPYIKRLEAAEVSHRDWRLKGSGVNPFAEVLAIWRLYRVLRSEETDLVLAYTPKGNIYGAFAANMTGAKIINNVSGLGRTFIKKSLLTSLVKRLYRTTFHLSSYIFFQNREDMSLFLEEHIIEPQNVERLPGSGVDLKRFVASKDARAGCNGEDIVFLVIGRMLWDKGIGEFVAAAREVKKIHANARFKLLGFVGADNPAAIPSEQIGLWEEEGIIEYLGETEDVIPIIQDADCVVLPSYREGVPRALLEAASMAKPIITTDAPGCRDTVDEGSTGFLCRVKDSSDLADKMLQMMRLTAEERAEMGMRGRRKMESEFDERIVIGRYLEVIKWLEGASNILPYLDNEATVVASDGQRKS